MRRLLRQHWGLGLQLLYCRVTFLTLSRSHSTSILARSTTICCKHWILVRNSALATFIIMIDFCGIVLITGRLPCWNYRFCLWEACCKLDSLYCSLHDIRSIWLQIYTRDFCFTFHTGLFLSSSKLFREVEFLGSKHFRIFQCIQFGFFLLFLLLFLAINGFLCFARVANGWSCRSHLDWVRLNWLTGRVSRSVGSLTFGKRTGLLRWLWSWKLCRSLKIGFTVTYTSSLRSRRSLRLFMVREDRPSSWVL